MRVIAAVAVILVAALHFGFLTLEMFFWDHPLGQKIFAMTPQQSAFSATLAANQGLYNGFLGAGLLWGLASRQADFMVFFLLCVIAAGIFGGATAKPTIYLIQALPGVIALFTVLITRLGRD
jgi:putative membrane protein